MKPTTSKLTSIKDTRKCPATPLVIPTAAHGYTSAGTTQAVTSRRLHLKNVDSKNDVLFNTSPTQESEIKPFPWEEDSRRTSPPARPRSKGTSLSPLSFNRESLLASPAMTHTLAGANSRRSAPSPAASPREQKRFSVQYQATSSHAMSKDFAPDFNLESSSAKTGNQEEALHRKAHASYNTRLSNIPYRDIFSPVPSEHTGDEGLQDYSTSTTWGKHIGDDSIGKFKVGSFPSIKVEDCDESGLGKSSPRFGNTDYGMKKSATVPGNSLGEVSSLNKQDAGRRNTMSLNVPSPVIKWRTAEGRLIAAMNDDLLTGALSRLCFRSEGNIPLALQDASEGIRGIDNRANQTENSSSLSRQFSRHVPHYFSSNPPGASNSATLMNAGRKERLLLTPTLQTELESTSKRSVSPGTLQIDMKKNAQFMSPQPQRRYGPRY